MIEQAKSWFPDFDFRPHSMLVIFETLGPFAASYAFMAGEVTPEPPEEEREWWMK